jgi:hypothetical protein
MLRGFLYIQNRSKMKHYDYTLLFHKDENIVGAGHLSATKVGVTELASLLENVKEDYMPNYGDFNKISVVNTVSIEDIVSNILGD